MSQTTRDASQRVRELTAERDALQLLVAELRGELRQLKGEAAELGSDEEGSDKVEAFDPVWYLGYYQDVSQLGMDPREHYDWIGHRLGRSPNQNAEKKRLKGAAGFWGIHR